MLIEGRGSAMSPNLGCKELILNLLLYFWFCFTKLFSSFATFTTEHSILIVFGEDTTLVETGIFVKKILKS